MKHIQPVLAPLAGVLCAAATLAHATEYGTVISRTPVTAQVPVTQRVCNDEQVYVAPRASGAGALFGALIGGAVGNSVGAGMGRAAATGLGVITGAAIGDRAEAESIPPSTALVQRCGVATRYEDRLVGYDVVYDYAGARHTARLAQDPGEPGTGIALEVNVAPVGASRPGRVGTPVPPAAPRRGSVDAYPEPVARSDESYAPPAYAPPTYAPQTYYAPPATYWLPAPAVYYGAYAGPMIWIGGGYRYYGGHRRWH